MQKKRGVLSIINYFFLCSLFNHLNSFLVVERQIDGLLLISLRSSFCGWD